MIDDDDNEELELDLEGALDAWESEFEKKAEAKSAPMPQSAPPPPPGGAPPPGGPKRPLYRPDPELEKRAAQQRKKRSHRLTPVKPVPRAKLSPEELRAKFPSFADEDDAASSSSTRVASVPDELMSTLAELEPGAHGTPTAPPPSGGVELDLDELLDEMEADTSMRDLDPPAAARRPSTPDELAAEKAIEALDQEEMLDPFDDADDAAIDDLLFGDDDEDEATRIAPSPALPAPVPPPPPPPLAVPKPAAAPKPAVPSPAVPSPAVAKPTVPKPAAAATGYKPKPPSAYRPKPPPGFTPPPPAADALPPVEPSSRSQVPTAPPPDDDDDDAATLLISDAPDLAPESDAPEDDDATTIGAPLALEDAGPALLLDGDEPDLEIGDEPDLEIGDEPDLEIGDEPDLELGDEPTFGEAIDAPPALELDEPELEFGDDEPELEFGDDDEPELEFGDDDEPELEFGDDDEPELEIGDEPDLGLDLPPPADGVPAFGGDSGLSALAPPPAGAAAAPAPVADHGAATARRTVSRRKPRVESYAFVGHELETLRNRAELLQTLGEKSQGTTAARAFLAAAEILERLGDADDARQLFQRAHEADPKELAALRSLRRDAIARADWPHAAEMLQAEAELELSPTDRAHALVLLAEIQLHQLGDPAAAEQAARASMAARPSAAAGLVLLEACRTQDRPAEAFVALQSTADAWKDDAGASALLEMAGRLAERSGKRERAHEAYGAAAERSGFFGARLGAARTASDDERGALLAKVAEGLSTPALVEVFRRLAALHAPDPVALTLLEDATRPMSLRAQADAARRANDDDARATAVESLAAATGATERALALVDLAEVRAGRGDLDGADEALRDATLADQTLDTVHVVREVLARRAGDSSRLARAVDAESDTGGALQAAAKVVRGDELDVERQWLGQAAARGEAPVAADVLGLDAAAEAGDDEAVAAALRRQADRATPDKRLGPLVELSAMKPDQNVDLWREAVAEHRPLVGLRALARSLASNEPAEAAKLLLEEADVASAEGAFQALVDAGRLLARAGDLEAAREAFERAMDALPGASPASWALDGMLAAAGDIDGLIASLRRVADSAETPHEGADAAIRAALIDIDPESAGGFLQQAHELLDRSATPDPILDSLLANASGVDPHTRAAFLEARAKAAEGTQARHFTLRAASAFEQSGEAAKAAILYREVSDTTPDAMVEVSLDRAELLAGEHARVSSRRFDAVKNATSPEQKLVALEALAAFDLYERGEVSSGVLTLQSILAEAPGHLPTLRALERYYMTDSRDEDLVRVERALLEHLSAADDVVAPARLAIRLMLLRAETPGDAADPIVMLTARHFAEGGGPKGDHWLARRVHAAAVAAGDTALQLATMNDIVRELAPAPDEQAALAVPLAELLEALESPEVAAETLAPHAEAHPDHPTVVEARARFLRAAGDHERAAPAFEKAAEATRVDPHRVELLYAAGREWEEIEQVEAALSAYERATSVDVTYADLFDRTRALLERTGERAKLATLIERRVAAGADGPTMVTLHEAHAKLAESLGDRPTAQRALKAALAIEPQRVETLKRLAKLSLAEGDWRAAAESLIRIARLRQDRDELRWVFFTLGDIYDKHMPDAKRAEAAFRRVLKLVPDDLEAMDRLAQLFEREQMHDKAIDTLQKLSDREIDPDERRRHRLRLALAHERRGDPRSAEHVLEDTRRQLPTDLEVLRAIAELYRRQGAQSALSMHLNRAVADFRKIILEDPADFLGWPGLVEVLEWRERRDAARVIASAAMGIGMGDPELATKVSPDGSVPGAGAAAADPELRDLLAPPALNRAVYEVFRLAGEAFEKALPFDTRAWRAEKVGRNDPARTEALRIGQWFGVGDVQLLTTNANPRVCIPVGESPVTLLVGHELLAMTNEAERAFLFARAIKAATAHLSVAMRSQPADLYLLVAGLLRAYDPNHSPPGLEARALEDMSKRVYKGIARRSRDAIGPLAVEMGGAPGFDAAKLGVAAGELGNHVALLALGSARAGFDALVKLSGGNAPTDGEARVSAVRSAPDAWSLLHFALSDAYFEARRRAGCDRL